MTIHFLQYLLQIFIMLFDSFISLDQKIAFQLIKNINSSSLKLKSHAQRYLFYKINVKGRHFNNNESC